MAYTEKYYLPFINVQGHECVVRFLFEGWGGSSTELTGGSKPFTLGEYNSDEDLFKPIRPQEATIEIIAKNGIISMDDFLSDNDSDIMVVFDLDAWTGYWKGYLTQDDIQETWIDTIHILTLRASEGVGSLKDTPLNRAGSAMSGIYTPYDILQYAVDQSALDWNTKTVISNLFHSSMSDDTDETGLDQCYVDVRTFEKHSLQYLRIHIRLWKRSTGHGIRLYFSIWANGFYSEFLNYLRRLRYRYTVLTLR
jgi:hypothetical protein